MSNEKPTPTRGVEIMLDRKRYLRYPIGVLKKLQAEEADKSLGQLLLLGLQKDDPSLTLDQLEDLIDLENLSALFEPVKKASGGIINLSKVFGKMMDDEGPQTPPPAAAQPDGQGGK